MRPYPKSVDEHHDVERSDVEEDTHGPAYATNDTLERNEAHVVDVVAKRRWTWMGLLSPWACLLFHHGHVFKPAQRGVPNERHAHEWRREEVAQETQSPHKLEAQLETEVAQKLYKEQMRKPTMIKPPRVPSFGRTTSLIRSRRRPSLSSIMR